MNYVIVYRDFPKGHWGEENLHPSRAYTRLTEAHPLYKPEDYATIEAPARALAILALREASPEKLSKKDAALIAQAAARILSGNQAQADEKAAKEHNAWRSKHPNAVNLMHAPRSFAEPRFGSMRSTANTCLLDYVGKKLGIPEGNTLHEKWGSQSKVEQSALYQAAVKVVDKFVEAGEKLYRVESSEAMVAENLKREMAEIHRLESRQSALATERAKIDENLGIFAVSVRADSVSVPKASRKSRAAERA